MIAAALAGAAGVVLGALLARRARAVERLEAFRLERELARSRRPR